MAVTTARQDILAAKANHIYRAVPGAITVNVVNAVILGVMMYDIADPVWVRVWGAVFVLLVLVRSGLYIAFRRTQPPADGVGIWVNAMVALMALFGVLWGSAAWVFMPAGLVHYHLLTAMVMIVLAVGAMSSLYPVMVAYVAFVAPMSVLLVIRFVTIGSEIHFAMAVSGGLLLGFLLMFARHHRDELTKTLMLRVENRDLLSAMSNENQVVRDENAEMTRMEALLRQKSAVLDAVSQVQGLFISERTPEKVFHETMETILELTQSEFGFIGEVRTDDAGQRYLKIMSVTDVNWDDAKRARYESEINDGLEFHDLDTLYTRVLKINDFVISNDQDNHQRMGGLTSEFPDIDTFLGMPLYMGEDMVGMFGVANRDGGYALELVTALEPVINATAGMINAIQNHRELDKAQMEAGHAMEQLSTAIESLNDGFAIYDKDDKFVLCNSKYKVLYSETQDLLIPGMPFETILREGVARGQYILDHDVAEEWIQNRLMLHRQKESLTEQKLADGTWLRVEEHETPDGGRAGIRVDITELKQAQEGLQKAMIETENASRAKTQFLSSMSHELRTPMNAVLGFAQLLQMNPQVPLHEKQRDSVNQILKAGNHLLELINEILDLSRIESGRVSLTMEEVDPHAVIEECRTIIAPLADKRSIQLDIDVPPENGYTIHADRTRFKQVLINLLSNAVKYNVANGRVTLTIHSIDGAFVRFCVSDTGPGIPQDKQEEIFQPFSRLGAETTDIEGTGIGLTISRNLAQVMGGKLGFESVLGQGSQFWIDMPGSAGTRRGDVHELQKDDALPSLEQKCTVLYVEDNADNLRLMEHVIAMVPGATLISAHTGELGIEMAEIHHPNVILMDINLPGINGDEALRRLRAMEVTSKIPVIAVSADAMPADIRRGLEAGFDAYLTKPINLAEVVQHIKMAAEGKLGPGAK